MNARQWLLLDVLQLVFLCTVLFREGGGLTVVMGLMCAFTGFVMCIQVERLRQGEA